jgi:hypothetical protein
MSKSGARSRNQDARRASRTRSTVTPIATIHGFQWEKKKGEISAT